MNQDQHIETRQRLLDAAGDVFAELGFRSATIRDICQKAGANVAAVNYHFGDKESLYRAVMKYARTCVMDFEKEIPVDVSVEEQLRAVIRAYLLRVFDTGRPSWHGKLLAREMVEPTTALDELVAEQIRPNHQWLKSLVAQIIGRNIDDEIVRVASFSVIAQCLYYYQSRPVISRLYPELKFGPAAIPELVDQIAEFTLHGLRGLRP